MWKMFLSTQRNGRKKQTSYGKSKVSIVEKGRRENRGWICSKRVFGNCVFLVIVIIVIWLTLKDSWEEIWSELNHTSWKIIAGVFSLSILYNCFDGIAVAKLVRNYAPGFAWQDGILCSFYYSFFRVVTFGSGTAAPQACTMSTRKEFLFQPAWESLLSIILYNALRFVCILFSAF